MPCLARSGFPGCADIMKILHVITGLSTGGAERALYNLLAGGLAQRFDTVVLSLRDEGNIGQRIQELDVPVHVLGMRGGIPMPRTLARLRHLVCKLQPDAIQGWMYHGNLAASLAARLAPGKPALAWNIRHSLYELKAEKCLTRQIIRINRMLSGCTDAVIYNSRLSRTQHEAFGFEVARGQIIPNGFDLEVLKPDPETGLAVRQEMDIPQDALVIGHVARFHPMKDHASFLRAAVQVAQEIPSLRLLIIGREVSPSHQALAGIVPPGLLDRFVFTGERSDAQRLMQAMDVFCLSSWSEAFPNVLGEAMASGVPCVTTDVGDCADIVADTGAVVSPSDSHALARGLMAMVRKHPEERQALGQAARERVKSYYGLDSVVSRYIELYEILSDRV